MKYGSICSGVAPQTKAWKALGLECAWFSEIESFPSAVLKHHFPEIPNLGDFTQIGTEHGSIDLLVGGTPCQSFSVAGKRAGLDDARGNLTIEFARLAQRLRPRWLVWENVPGVLSIDGGRTFGIFLGMLGRLGYGFAYRVLDAQYFGVAQRRRRVFVVGCLGDWRSAAAVLFERESLSGNPAPSREKGPAVTALTSNGVGTCGADDNQAQGGHLLACSLGEDGELARALTATHTATGRLDPNEQNFIVAIQSVNMVCERKQNGIGISDEEVMYTVTGRDQHAVAFGFSAGQSAEAGSLGYQEEVSPTLRGAASGTNQVPAVAFAENQRGELRTSDISPQLSCAGGKPGSGYPAVLSIMPMNSGKDYKARQVEVAQPVMTQPVGGAQGGDYVTQHMAVRRLTPRECERLQGMSDDYTLIPWRGKMAPDGPRYKAIGNSWAVPVLKWIAKRIMEVESIGGR